MAAGLVPATSIVGTLAPGVEGRVQGLQNAPHLNSLNALIIDHDPGTGRYKVLCENDQNIALRPENLYVAAGAQTVEGGKRLPSRNSEVRINMTNSATPIGRSSSSGPSGPRGSSSMSHGLSGAAANRLSASAQTAANSGNGIGNAVDIDDNISRDNSSSHQSRDTNVANNANQNRGAGQPVFNRSDTKWYEETVLYEHFPFTTVITGGGLLWITIFTIILIYAPR